MSNASNAVNGVSKKKKKDRTEESSRKPLQFGILTERLESETQKFQPASDALHNISSIMHQYRSEIEVFASNFGTLQAKDEEIKELRAMVRLWKSTRDEENDSLKTEIKVMKEDEENFRKEKQTFEQRRNETVQEERRVQAEFAKKEKQLKNDYEKRFEQAKSALREETHDTITQLRAAKGETAKQNAILETRLAQEDSTRKRAEADWLILRNTHDATNKKLGEELESLKRDFAMEERPDEF